MVDRARNGRITLRWMLGMSIGDLGETSSGSFRSGSFDIIVETASNDGTVNE